MSNPALKLNGYAFADLFQAESLARLDQQFLAELNSTHPQLHADLLAYRHDSEKFSPIETSELLITLARILEEFLARLFNIEEAAALAQAKTISSNPVSVFKKYYVLRRSKKLLTKADTLPSFATLNTWLQNELKKLRSKPMIWSYQSPC